MARHTAARLWRAVVPDDPDVHLNLRSGTRMEVSCVDARVRDDAPSSIAQGSLSTTPGHSFVDLAADLPLVDLVVLGDTLVRRGLLHPQSLVAAADDAYRPRSRRADGPPPGPNRSRLSDGEPAAHASGTGRTAGAGRQPHRSGRPRTGCSGWTWRIPRSRSRASTTVANTPRSPGVSGSRTSGGRGGSRAALADRDRLFSDDRVRPPGPATLTGSRVCCEREACRRA